MNKDFLKLRMDRRVAFVKEVVGGFYVFLAEGYFFEPKLTHKLTGRVEAGFLHAATFEQIKEYMDKVILLDDGEAELKKTVRFNFLEAARWGWRTKRIGKSGN